MCIFWWANKILVLITEKVTMVNDETDHCCWIGFNYFMRLPDLLPTRYSFSHKCLCFCNESLAAYIRCCWLSAAAGFDAAPRSLAPLEPLQLPLPLPPFPRVFLNAAATIMTGIAAVSFFSNACRFAGCGLHFDSLSELIVHIEDEHIGKSTSALPWPRVGASSRWD